MKIDNPFLLAIVLAHQSHGAIISIRDLSLSASTRITTTNAGLGTSSSLTTISAGVNYWLSGFSTHNIKGNLNNYGSIVISQTDSSVASYGGQTVVWTGSDSSNGNLRNYAGASISLNDVSAKSAPTYDWYLNSMQNDGTVQFCGRGDTGGSTFQLYCRTNCVNNGLIDFTQVYGNLGTAAVWRNYALSPGTGAASQSITHNGGFLMRSMRVDFVQNFQGIGCWMIGNKAVMYLQDGTGYYQNQGFGSTLAGQSISFLDNTGVLHMDTKVYSLNAAFGAKIYGFGQGNAIECYETIKSVSYAGAILTIKFSSGNTANLNIGSGYAASAFSISARKSNYANYNAIFYSLAAPVVTVPTQCALTTPICSALTDSSSTSSIARVSTIASQSPSSASSLQSTTTTSTITSTAQATTTMNLQAKVPVTSTTIAQFQATSTTTGAIAPVATNTGSFYLQNSCDKSCLGHFGSDYQLYSNAMTSTDTTYDLFSISKGQLFMSSTNYACVASEAGGSASRLQCSNDYDNVNGVIVTGGFAFAGTALSYQANSAWAGCGVLDLANNYEPNGLTYSADGVTADNCRACTLTRVYSLAECAYAA